MCGLALHSTAESDHNMHSRINPNLDATLLMAFCCSLLTISSIILPSPFTSLHEWQENRQTCVKVTLSPSSPSNIIWEGGGGREKGGGEIGRGKEERGRVGRGEEEWGKGRRSAVCTLSGLVIATVVRINSVVYTYHMPNLRVWLSILTDT